MRLGIFIFILCTCHLLLSQKISPQIISSSGNAHKADRVYLQWTLGELIIDYQNTGNALISEGFHFADPATIRMNFPDITVTALTAIPATVPRNEILTVNATISNLGINASEANTVGIFLSEDNILDGNDIVVQSVEIGGLDHNGSTTITIEIDLQELDLELKTHFIIVCPDITNQIEETDEENNCAPVSFEVIEAFKPDLILENLRVDNSCILPGDAVGLDVNLVNQGLNSAPSSVTSVYLANNPTRSVSDVRLLSFDLGQGIRPGERQKAVEILMIPQNVAPGDYFLISCADDFGNIMELDETNNCIAIPITIRSDMSECLPDGTIFSARSSVFCILSGSSLDVSYVLANIGPFPTTRSSSITHFLSSDGSLDASDPILYNRFVPSLDAFSSFDITQNLLIPPNTPEGSYRIYICYDAFDVVTEDNETNNCDSVVFEVITAGKPDFVPDRLFLPDNCLEYGKFYDMQYRVSNVGRFTAEFSTAHYYISTDTRLSNDDVFLADRDIRAIPLCASIDIEDQFRYNKLIPGGNYFLIVEIDGLKNIDEESENNNTTAFPITIKIPDIALIKNIPEGQEVQIGCPDTFAIEVQNIGNKDADLFIVGVFLAVGPFLSGDDVLIGQDTVAALLINETLLLNLPTIIPKVSEGDYYLIFIANIYDGINEADKMNSMCTVKVKLIPKRPPQKDVKDLIEYYFFQRNVGELNPLLINQNGGS